MYLLDNVLIIMAGGGMMHDGFVASGYTVCQPYKDYNIYMRILRELNQLLHILKKDFFYDKKILKYHPKHILIYDPLITLDYLRWLKKIFPETSIHFLYRNMVGKAHHLKPEELPSWIDVWTYDGYDSRKYHIKQYDGFYFPVFCKPARKVKDIDVLFIGRDKGRAVFLLDLEKKLKMMGLKTKFIITKSTRCSFPKPFYQKMIPYNEICNLISRSKSILNVTMEFQEGLSIRDFEALFNATKLITTNKAINKTPFYCKNNIFILTQNNLNDIAHFLQTDIVHVEDSLLNKYTIESFIFQIIGR